MKFLIIGLGNFGSALGTRLTSLGHEVIGVDAEMNKIEAVKDNITYAIQLDSTDKNAIMTLPYQDSDVVIVGIGENFGDSIMTTALLKQLGVKRLISRAINPLHETVLQAIGVEEIIHPEMETAGRLAKKLEMKGVVDSFYVSGKYNIIEAKVPDNYIGKTVAEVDLRRNHNLNIITILRNRDKKENNVNTSKTKKVIGVIKPETVFEEGDTLVLFGDEKDIKKLLDL